MKMKIKNIWKNNEAVSPVIAVILMVAITVVLAAVLYVWAAGLASTGGSAPPAFSASVVDSADAITTYSTAVAPPNAGVGNKNLGTKTGAQTGSTFTAGVTIAPKAYTSGTAFAVTYAGDAWPLAPSPIVTVTYEDENGVSSTAGAVTFDVTKSLATGFTMNASLETGDIGVKKVTGITLDDGRADTFGANNTFYVNTSAYDTICKITADNGKPGDITKLTLYVKIGANGDWKKLIPDSASPYKIGAVVLDNAATDLSWDVGESVYISETSTGDLAPNTLNPVFLKVIHEPSSSTIYESKTGVNLL